MFKNRKFLSYIGLPFGFILSSFSIHSTFETIDNRNKHLNSIKNKKEYIYKEKNNYFTNYIEDLLKYWFTSSASKNKIPVKNIEFSNSLYNKMKNHINFYDYCTNLDIIFNESKHIIKDLNKLNDWNIINNLVKFNNSIKFYISKRQYEIVGYEGYCFGMCCILAKASLTNTMKDIDFKNGPDDESKAYQILYEKQHKSVLGFIFITIFAKKLSKIIGFKITNNIEVTTDIKLNIDGVYLLKIEIEEENSGHAMTIIKNKDNILFFDPNLGTIELTEAQILKLIKETYKPDRIYLEKIELI
jgi:hypothetical protein